MGVVVICVIVFIVFYVFPYMYIYSLDGWVQFSKLRILIVMYALFCIFCFRRANWHSSANLTEVFPCIFLSSKANSRV